MQTTRRQRWAFLGVVSLGLLLIGLDNSILYTALPALSEQLHATPTQQLWIINAYALTLAGLLLGTGTLGDRVGHRRMFLIGLTVFGLASLSAAVAPSAGFLIAARAFLGLGAAIMMPATLALIRVTFVDEIERNTAIGIWGSVAVVGAASGPTVGGFLLEHYWWGSVFLINVPIVLIAIALTTWLAPPNMPNPHKQWDVLSSLYALVSLSSLVLFIKSVASTHPDVVLALSAAILCVLGAWVFTQRQKKLADPLLTFDIFRSPIFTGGVVTAAGAMFGMAGLEMLTTQKLQLVDAFSPLQAGLVISAVALSALPMSALGGANLHRWGFRNIIVTGFLAMGAGMTVAVIAESNDHLYAFIGGLIITGIGAGLTMSVASTAIIGAAPPERTGMAASMEEVSYELGTLLSIAVTGSIVPALYSTRLPEELRALGMDALHVGAENGAAAGAYSSAYGSTIAGLVLAMAVFAGITAWYFRTNPKSGGAHAAH
ncbi:MFS transporter [Corynebacterium sp. 319]|uniref:MFS transporter n=1 Tax=unclassified Corynebacterium TaxID=2624378 RepID=UPI00125CCAB4|nr:MULTISPECIES: MFS transporter [unclassified Corynebacterium]KAB1553486.1 MFS transporter [Corynebacterium sp. 319]KAB3540770.1 MFS transporter [Corynebacterium sp. 366]